MTRRIELDIAGMSCAHCVQQVTNALKGVRGVREAAVDLESGRATVEVEAGVVVEHLQESVEEAGYQARPAREEGD